jgi:hypothetical protein
MVIFTKELWRLSIAYGAMMAPEGLIALLGDALRKAAAHLDYCGYGDSWEREIAVAEDLPEEVDFALGKFIEYEKEQKTR